MVDEPETTADAGTANEETVTETTEETPVIDTPADDSADDDSEDSEGEVTAQGVKGETNVPYSRFKNVNERRKAAELKASELEAKLQKYEGPKGPVAATPKERIKGLKAAPVDMTPIEQMEWYGVQALEAHPEILDQWFERKFGVKPEAAAATLAHSTVSTRDQIRSQFEAACAARGLNSKDPNLQAIVGSAMDTGKFKSFGEAMDVFVKPKTNGTSPKKVVGKGAESEGVDVGGLSRVRVLPKNAKEAGVLAAKGQAIEHVSVTDILKASV